MTNAMMETQQQELALKDLRSLYDLVSSLESSEGRDGIVTTFLEKLNHVVPFDTCAIMQADTDGGSFVITHAAGEHAGSLVDRQIVTGERISGWVLANRQPFYNTDPRIDLPSSLVDRFSDYRTLAISPILKGNKLFGAVALYSSSLSKYDKTHQRLLTEASGFLALALAAHGPATSIDDHPNTTVEANSTRFSSSLNNPTLVPIHISA